MFGGLGELENATHTSNAIVMATAAGLTASLEQGNGALSKVTPCDSCV